MDKKYGIIALVLLGGVLLYHKTRSEEINKRLIVPLTDKLFYIRFDANPTTGYNWSMTNITNPDIVEPLSASYQPDDVPAGVVGSGGTETFVFKALDKGTTAITFTYKRDWKGGGVAKIVTYHITIE